MFTVYALNLSESTDTEAECATLDEALTHLRELVLSEMADPDGPIFDRYGVYFDPSVEQNAV
ncbi:MAG: hypothetical protein L0219_06285 [Phycisphaerales bacterium]|nr:hypothetical protein [Phycisphaerales bacterium]